VKKEKKKKKQATIGTPRRGGGQWAGGEGRKKVLPRESWGDGGIVALQVKSRKNSGGKI